MTVFCSKCKKKMRLNIKDSILTGVWISAKCAGCKYVENINVKLEGQYSYMEELK